MATLGIHVDLSKTSNLYTQKKVSLNFANAQIIKNKKIILPKNKFNAGITPSAAFTPLPDVQLSCSEKIIISLTSYPARIQYVKTVLESILAQNIDKSLYKVVLVLAEPEFINKEQSLPCDLTNFIHNNENMIEIIWHPTNIRSHKKLIPTLLKYPYNPILICDDDVKRPQGWLKMFILDHLRYPNDIIFGVSSWYFAYDLILKRFSQYKCAKSGPVNNLHNQVFKTAKPANGLGGVLYPVNTFTDARFFNEELFMKLSPTSDESWQFCFNIIENRTLRQSSIIYDYSKYFLKGTQEIPTSLHRVNNYTKINNDLFNYFPEFKKELLNRNKQIIVTLTSHGERVKNLDNTLTSLLQQKLKAYKIVLSLTQTDASLINKNTQKLIDNGDVELLIVPEDLGPHTKYYYTMKKYKEYPIITVDDDHIYSNDLISSLYKSYCNYPACISARRVHKIKWINNKLMPYNKWQFICNTILEPSRELFATGVGGVLYPPNILQIDQVNIDNIKKCLYADDIFLKWLENQLGVLTVYTKNNRPVGTEIKNNIYDRTALCIQNCINKRNDEYLKIFKLTR